MKRNNVFNFLIITFLSLSNFCLGVTPSYDPLSDPMYRNIEVYNSTDNKISIDFVISYKSNKADKQIVLYANTLLDPKGILKDKKIPEEVFKEASDVEIGIRIRNERNSKNLGIFTIKGITHQSNIFIDIKPNDDVTKVVPYSDPRLFGQKKSRTGKLLIHNPSFKNIKSNYF